METRLRCFGRGKYDVLYGSVSTFLWGEQPGSFVARFLTDLDHSSVLDLGCGDGKNASWLLQRSNRVVGVDVSSIALDQARLRLMRQAGSSGFWGLIQADAACPPLTANFDAVVLYGLLHCMDECTAISTLSWVSQHLNPGGIAVGAALSAQLPVPKAHATGQLFLRSEKWYTATFGRYFDILKIECGLLRETHPPLVPVHDHGVVRFALHQRGHLLSNQARTLR